MISRDVGVIAPPGEQVYEILLTLKSEPSALATVLKKLGDMNVNVLGIFGHVSEDGSRGYILLYVDAQKAKAPVSELLDEIKSLSPVLDVSAENKTKMIFENMMFPLSSRGERGLYVSAEGYSSLISQVMNTFGDGGATILHQQGAALGKSFVDGLVRRLRREAGTDLILENIKGFIKASGFGILTTYTGQGNSRVKVEIHKPVLNQATGAPFTDHLLVGLVHGALERAFQKEYTVKKPSFSSERIEFELIAQTTE
ncbi:MAG: hypothetical protein QW767_05090 [Thermoprotei archaeon]